MRLIVWSLFLLVINSATAATIVENGSFESGKIARKGVDTETILKDEELKKTVLGRWLPVAWGTPGATRNSMSIVEAADAPHGKLVGQIDNKVNQISVFAYGLEKDELQPGKWYEVTAKIRTENLHGQGAFVNVEFWDHGYGAGSIDSEHLCETVDWKSGTVRFIAPPKKYNVNISLWAFGGPGKVWYDDVQLRQIPPPKIDTSKRTVLKDPFWGMFTCYANYLHRHGKEMKTAGVYWQRQGTGGLAAENQKFMESNGMAFQMCLDGMPAAKDPKDPCYPVTESCEYKKWLQGCADKAGKSVRIFEVFNEPNTHVQWTLPGYANLLILAGQVLDAHPKGKDILFATGGFTSPQIGYTEACLKCGADKVLDIVLMHPYAVDEPLDSQLYAMAEACNRAGRPDIAVAINETGFPTWDPETGIAVNPWFVSEKDQAIKVIKLHLQALAHKLSFVTYLGWNDFTTEPSDQAKNMGLVRLDGSAKPALHAYKFMRKTLGPRPRVIQWKYDENGTRVYQFEVPGNKSVWVVWNAIGDNETTVNVGKTRVFPCDIYGTKLTVTPTSIQTKITAGYEPTYLVPVD
ncbi:MAG: hypothetical protein JXM70_20315 [Pirellulales bacterium]|nr:hypothetical protein [Pirellulales bacterium]